MYMGFWKAPWSSKLMRSAMVQKVAAEYPTSQPVTENVSLLLVAHQSMDTCFPIQRRLKKKAKGEVWAPSCLYCAHDMVRLLYEMLQYLRIFGIKAIYP